ncbi:MAG: hypothetical protein IPI91_19720 [Flavobacteriales bacterium]|nr:hypothetical protein [Flavobacteriales bacterium]
MSTIAFIDTRGEKISKTALETLTFANKVAQKSGGSVTAITFGNTPADRLATLPVAKVIVARNANDADSQQLTKLVADIAQKRPLR